ncbi:energy transducer TonB [Parasphingopyxis sp.]|uniref:energy transducer TonB n=1 Tax=Parasphingopyxis sp. TaxID=1920299 RepID=UPI00261A3EA3|nr:energy transducer TonB [Parasphingopyxis sp.]
MRKFLVSFATASAASIALANPVFAQTQPTPAVPLGNPSLWITNADYPAMSIRLEEEGTAGFRLRVGADGRVKECTITSSTGSELLDEQTCGALTFRARFAPARDGEGNPIEGSYSSSVRWEIPRSSLGDMEDASLGVRPSAYLVEFVVDFAVDGTVLNCQLAFVEPASEIVEAMEQQFCQQYEYSGFQILPYTDEDGNPVPRRIRTRMSTSIEEIPESDTVE